MADKKTDAKAPKPTEPTERMVLAGFELDVGAVAKALVGSGFGQVPETIPHTKDQTEKLVKSVEEQVKGSAAAAGAQDGKVIIWMPIGVAHDSDRKKAIRAKVSSDRCLGFYRAPSVSSWKGGIAARPPAQIAPDVEALD